MDQFATKIESAKWKTVSELYDKALKLKADKLKNEKKKDLIKLDKWYQTELPGIIQARSPRSITRDELCQLMKWKLTRGKFRPRLTEMVQVNTEEEVKSASTEAFKKLPDIAAAIKSLVVLKAVGPATASAVLAAGAPGKAAFMADESMLALPGLQPIKYDLPFYKEYMKRVNSIVTLLKKDDPETKWTPHKVELVLWTYQMCKTMDASLLSQPKETKKRKSDAGEKVAKKQKT